MLYYGYETPDTDLSPGGGYPLAAWIWGHRLRVGQHWMEYLLEFLNVLAGFAYTLGQGIAGDVSPDAEYERFVRLGLRRFVFYDEKERNRHDIDNKAVQQIYAALEKRGQIGSTGTQQEKTLTLARTLLRAFSAVEEQRSWYAKSLFPVHHSLLFWQGDRNNKKNIHPDQPDTTVTLTKRNFYARGGEIYYLILSAGTKHTPERRALIANQMKALLNNHYSALGNLAQWIDTTWQQCLNGDAPLEQGTQGKCGTLGWIPEPDSPLYVTIAEDVATLLQTERDPIETLDLLAHLIGFHLTCYIYHHAKPDSFDDHHPLLLIDALEGADGGVIRQLSATLFREQEVLITQRGQQYVAQVIQEWSQQSENHNIHSLASDLWAKAQTHFNKKTQPAWVDHMQQKLDNGNLSYAGFIEQFADTLFTKELKSDFDKNFVGVHRKLAKGVGFVAPKIGTGGRFVLGDTLLKALTLANISSDQTEMSYDMFLAQLYRRYGLIIGQQEVGQSGLFERQPIDREYYKRNAEALLEKMKRAGLAIEYSDATAMVNLGIQQA
jgi:hypothetical protein